MKTVLIALWLAMLSGYCHAQNFKEWFRQNKTQKEYLIEQIAQLKIYLEFTKEGYKIAKEGLEIIHQIKNGEFALHKNRFDSLRIVKTGIIKLARIQYIQDLDAGIAELCAKLPAEISQCASLDARLKKQLQGALASLDDDCQILAAGLTMVLKDGQVSMTDDQRVKRIEDIGAEFEENYVFAQNLRRDFTALCQSATNELIDIEHRRAIHGTD